MKKKFAGTTSNWETVAFILIENILVGNNPYFNRRELMKAEHLIFAVKLLEFVFQHKKAPKASESTLQRTIQNMRDKNWIQFLGSGEYKLTKKGIDELEKIKEAGFSYDVLGAAMRDADLIP